MSTKIEDLPGPIPEDVRNDLNNIEHNIRREEEIVRQNTLQNSHSQPPPPINPDLYKQAPQESNIQFNIKKRVKFQDEIDTTSVIEFLKNEEIDVLVNNAGINKIDKFAEIDIEDFDMIGGSPDIIYQFSSLYTIFDNNFSNNFHTILPDAYPRKGTLYTYINNLH